jgi:hypothetical protein
MKSSIAAWKRARQQWAEARCESMDDATVKNFWAMAPQGTKLDDKNEPGIMDYLKSKGVGKFISESGYF